jgi:hypothetical protein
MGLDEPYQLGGWTEGVYMDNNVPLSQAYNDLLSFDDVPVRVNGEAAIKHFLASEVIPFFADADRLDSQLRVTEASFEDGSAGHMAYSYVVTTSGQMKPFVIAWRGGSNKLRVMDVQMGRCVKARHPVTPGRCER